MNIATATRAVLPPLVAACARNRVKVVIFGVLLAAACVLLTATRLGVTTDTSLMFANDLAWKQRSADLDRLFPQNDDLIVAVVDARIPEEAEAAAAALAEAIRGDHAHFDSVRQPDLVHTPGQPPYLEKNAFLLISKPDLQDVLDSTTDAQPFLGQLVADPSLRGLFSALDLVVAGATHGVDVSAMDAPLARFHQSLAAAATGRSVPLSWMEFLGGKLADQAGRYRFVLAKAKLDYGALEPGGAATKAIRAAAETIPLVQHGEARVRLTGQVVLDDEEFGTVAQGAVAGLIGSFLLVMLWLYLAVRSWRLMLPVMATLVLGLVITTGFAALAIGTLNLISVAFAVLFVGIAVDFAIQFTVRLRERRHSYPDMTDALRETGRRSGAQILVASLATAAGFLAFTPTQFVGVAQLGIIAGVGMLIAFACTLTFLPALLCLCHPRKEPREVGFAFAKKLDVPAVRNRLPIVLIFVALATAGIIVAPTIRFDGDPLHTKDQNSEAIRTLHDLMADPITNPYTLQALLPSDAAAQDAARRYESLSLTQDVLSLQSFVPQEQDAKLAAIRDAANLLTPTLTPPAQVPTVTPAALRDASAKLAAAVGAATPKLKRNDPLLTIGADAHKLAGASDAVLLAANDALTRYLPLQLERLREALRAQPVTLADVPVDLKREWVLPDGRARVQALPKAAVVNGRTMRSWVKAALKVVPESAGSAVWILKSADTITHAFQIAAYSALCAIAIILALALRRVLDVLLVLTPLVVSGLLTALLLKMSGMSLNFANIIALPLLLGVGVSFNVYFVMNWRAGMHHFVSSASARAVLFSALTTGTAFGSLALSHDRGMASMGSMLLLSLAAVLAATFVFLPALLYTIRSSGSAFNPD